MSEVYSVFGIHAVASLLDRQPDRIEAMYVQRGRNDSRMESLLERADKLGISYQVIEREKLDEMVDGRHQGVIVKSRGSQIFREGDLDRLLENLDRPALLLILDGVTDPHNLGACLRTADAAGVDAVIVPKDNAAGLNATARKVQLRSCRWCRSLTLRVPCAIFSRLAFGLPAPLARLSSQFIKWI